MGIFYVVANCSRLPAGKFRVFAMSKLLESSDYPPSRCSIPTALRRASTHRPPHAPLSGSGHPVRKIRSNFFTSEFRKAALTTILKTCYKLQIAGSIKAISLHLFLYNSKLSHFNFTTFPREKQCNPTTDWISSYYSVTRKVQVSINKKYPDRYRLLFDKGFGKIRRCANRHTYIRSKDKSHTYFSKSPTPESRYCLHGT